MAGLALHRARPGSGCRRKVTGSVKPCGPSRAARLLLCVLAVAAVLAGTAGSARGSRTRVCSPASSVLRVRQTAQRRACRPYRSRRSPTVPFHKHRKPLGSPGSRVWNFHACSGSSTPPQTPAPHLNGAGVVAFSTIEQDRPATYRFRSSMAGLRFPPVRTLRR